MKYNRAYTAILVCVLVALAVVPTWASDAFTEGLALFNAGKWPEAADRLVEAADHNPNDVVVRLTAGVALANLRRYSEAIAQFTAAARLSPGGVLPQLLLDGTYSEMGDAARAREARGRASTILARPGAFGAAESSDQLLARSLLKHPENAIARSLLGDMYQLQGKLQPAKEQYIKASELAPKWAKPVFNLGLANLQSDAKAAEQNFEQALKMDPSNRRAYLWMGDAYLHQGRLEDAIRAYRNAEQERLLAPEAQTRIGNAQLRAGDFRAASEEFGRAEKQAPQDPRPIVGQAEVYRNIGKLKEAETKLNQAAQVLASNQAMPLSQAVVQQQIAQVQVKMGKTEQAIDSLKMGYELHPTSSNAWALVTAQNSAGKLAEGIAENEALLKNDRNNRSALIYLLSAYKVNANWTGVIDTGSRLVSLDPSNASLYYAEVGAARLRAGDVDAAVEAYMRAMNAGNAATWPETARHAKDSGALAALEERVDKAFRTRPRRSTGVVLYELRSAAKDTRGMVEVADRLAKLYPDDSVSWLLLGQAYEQSGDQQMALIAYAKAAAGSDPEAAAAAKARMAVLRGK